MIGLPPTAETFERIAGAAFDDLPEGVRAAAGVVMIRTADFPPDEVLRDMGLDSPYELTGLYEGVPLIDRSEQDVAPMPSAIWLYRRPILEEWIDRGDVSLERLVSHVLVHELAHHFGWSDDDIAAIDRWWE